MQITLESAIMTTEHADQTGLESPFGQLSANWAWLLALGIMFVVLGTFGIGMASIVTLGSVVFFGVMLLVGGAAQLVQAFKCSGWKAIVWQILIGVLYLVAGVEVITNPVGASVILTLLLGATIGAVGAARIVLAINHRGTAGWTWTLIGGAVTVLLSFMILSQWPVSGMWVIGLLISVEMIVNGWSAIVLALAAKNAPGGGDATVEPSAQPA